MEAISRHVLIKNKILQILVGCGSVALLYLAELLSTIGYMDDRYWILHLIAILLFGMCIFAFVTVRKCDRQVKLIVHLLFVCTIINIVSSFAYDIEKLGVFSALSKMLFLLIAIILEIRMGFVNECKRGIRRIKETISDPDIWGLVFLCVIGIVLAYDSQMLQFRWDGALYYESVDNANLYSYSSLALYGHQSQSVAAIMCFCTNLMGHNTAYGMVVANLLIYIVGVIYFWKVVRELVRGRGVIFYTAAAAVFAFSPYLLGMINYYSVDYYLICMFPVVLYYTVRKEWVLQVLSGSMFVFTKEPAIVIYGCLCIGVLVFDIIGLRHNKDEKWVRKLFLEPRYYGMLLCAALWLMSIKLLGAWAAGSSSVGIDGKYVLEKIKVLYILNFSWLFVGIIVILSIICCVLERKAGIKKFSIRTELIMLIPLFGFTLFSCVFQTVNHARYVDIVPVILFLLTILKADRLLGIITYNISNGHNKAKGSIINSLLGALALLNLVSCYITVDPVSKLCFITEDIGNTSMLTTADAKVQLGDSMIYNKQMLWLGETMDMAIEDAMDMGAQIVLPYINGSYYFVDGASGVEMDELDSYVVTHEYWDVNRKMRCVLPGEDTIALDIISTSEASVYHQNASDDIIYAYICPQMLKDEEYIGIENSRVIVSKKTYNYRGWVVDMICYK